MAHVSSAQRHAIVMASLVRKHAIDICRLFEGVSPVECEEEFTCTQEHKGVLWAVEVMHLFWEINAELTGCLSCHTSDSPSETSLAIHAMQHTADLLRHSHILFLWSSQSQKVYNTLALIVHGRCFKTRLKCTKNALCTLFASVGKSVGDNKFPALKKSLNASLCRMSAKYLCSANKLELQFRHPKAAVDTLISESCMIWSSTRETSV